ncbi:TRAP transporter small permease [Aquabacterium sp.]|uniref:TRAP transporter small permease n=1 Tax=Aquabacterium sp. TaxID=1872578 RepID=UPI002BEC5197|nr:TRAP transporter small permease [Aquabacterium sp.]HSW04978.1 TRAP transporter small permease [Aquabacterium sp.]
MKSFERHFLAANRWALIGLLAAMAVIVFANVALRYLTNESIEWAEEVARHLMIWLTFLGAGPVLRYGGHIAVDNLQDGVPQAAAVMLRWLIALLLLGFFGFMVWFGGHYMLRAQGQTTAATQISFAYVYAAMPVGGVVLIVHWLLIVRGYLRERLFAADAHFDANASASL